MEKTNYDKELKELAEFNKPTPEDLKRWASYVTETVETLNRNVLEEAKGIEEGKIKPPKPDFAGKPRMDVIPDDEP